jgi:citronellol/citronellal dehydrogenase
VVDIRDEERVADAVREAADKFGGIDILINNASAIRTTGTLDTPVRRYDLMHGVNGRGTFVCSQACLPYLMKAENPHILTISPPLTHEAKWFKPHPPYSIAKYTMSLFTPALAAEFAEHGVAVNSLWPRRVIATAAVLCELGGVEMIRVIIFVGRQLLTEMADRGERDPGGRGPRVGLHGETHHQSSPTSALRRRNRTAGKS